MGKSKQPIDQATHVPLVHAGSTMTPTCLRCAALPRGRACVVKAEETAEAVVRDFMRLCPVRRAGCMRRPCLRKPCLFGKRMQWIKSMERAVKAGR